METSSSSSSIHNRNSNSTTTSTTLPSELVVSSYIQKGLQDVAVYTSIGFVVGGLMGIVLTRGTNPASRKIYSSLGSGIGFGMAWTQTSIQLEQLLLPIQSSSTTTTTKKK
jgi:hypothetical protein